MSGRKSPLVWINDPHRRYKPADISGNRCTHRTRRGAAAALCRRAMPHPPIDNPVAGGGQHVPANRRTGAALLIGAPHRPTTWLVSTGGILTGWPLATEQPDPMVRPNHELVAVAYRGRGGRRDVAGRGGGPHRRPPRRRGLTWAVPDGKARRRARTGGVVGCSFWPGDDKVSGDDGDGEHLPSSSTCWTEKALWRRWRYLDESVWGKAASRYCLIWLSLSRWFARAECFVASDCSFSEWWFIYCRYGGVCATLDHVASLAAPTTR